MKYIIVLADGMADEPVKEYGDKTPMESADIKNIRSICKKSLQGTVSSIPPGMDPGSDVANLSILGYDPAVYYKGRSSIEAASIGVTLCDSDLAIRANLITLDNADVYDKRVMLDHGADDISTSEAHILMDFLKTELSSCPISFYNGTSYRNLAVIADCSDIPSFTPPHDIPGKQIGSYMPKGHMSDMLIDIMQKSSILLSSHPANEKRIKKGLNPANSLWFWGPGRKMSLPSFYDLYNLRGAVISAVDLVKGIGCLSGMRILYVPGATGTIHTDYTGKVNACIKALNEGLDFIYLHVEAPDECGHKGDYINKTKAIELIDEKIIGPILGSSDILGRFRVMILPDHATPVSTRTHDSSPVPFLIYDSEKAYDGMNDYSEKISRTTGISMSDGKSLMELFIR